MAEYESEMGREGERERERGERGKESSLYILND